MCGYDWFGMAETQWTDSNVARDGDVSRGTTLRVYKFIFKEGRAVRTMKFGGHLGSARLPLYCTTLPNYFKRV